MTKWFLTYYYSATKHYVKRYIFAILLEDRLPIFYTVASSVTLCSRLQGIDPVFPMCSLKLYQSLLCLRLAATGNSLRGPDLLSLGT